MLWSKSFCFCLIERKIDGADLLIKDLKLKFGTDGIDQNSHTLGVLGDKTWSTVGLLALGVVERLVAETEWSHQILKVFFFFLFL
jgi:hypothetical protein